MGRYAETVPTAETVWDVVKQLKPEKREKYLEEARERGWNFEQYLVERITVNVLKRKRLAGEGEDGGMSDYEEVVKHRTVEERYRPFGEEEDASEYDEYDEEIVDEEDGVHENNSNNLEEFFERFPDDPGALAEHPDPNAAAWITVAQTQHNAPQTPPTSSLLGSTSSTGSPAAPAHALTLPPPPHGRVPIEISESCNATVGCLSSPRQGTLPESSRDDESVSSENNNSEPMSAWDLPRVHDYSESVIVELDDDSGSDTDGSRGSSNNASGGSSGGSIGTRHLIAIESPRQGSIIEIPETCLAETQITQADTQRNERHRPEVAEPAADTTVVLETELTHSTVPSCSDFDGFSTQQLEEEVLRRKRKRGDGNEDGEADTERPHRRTIATSLDVRSPLSRGQLTSSSLPDQVPPTQAHDGRQLLSPFCPIQASARARQPSRAFLDYVLVPMSEHEALQGYRGHDPIILDSDSEPPASPHSPVTDDILSYIRTRRTHYRDAFDSDDDRDDERAVVRGSSLIYRSGSAQSAFIAPPRGQSQRPTQWSSHRTPRPATQSGNEREELSLSDSHQTPLRVIQPEREGDEVSPFDPPPSGGAASRAAPEPFQNSPIGSPFVTAANSPTSLVDHDPPDSIPVLDTQEWQAIFNSQQGQALFASARTATSLLTPLPSSNPEQGQVQQVQQVHTLHASPDFQTGAHVQVDTDCIRYRFDIKDIPPHSTTVWCVRKGFVPGFHFREPWWLSDTLATCKYQTFDFNKHSAATVMARAVRYMNDVPQEIIPTIEQSPGENTYISPDSPSQQLEVDLAAVSEFVRSPSRLCAVCDTPLHNVRAVLCLQCSSEPSRDPSLINCIKSHTLCKEQADVLRKASRGENIFYTGAAGTGKSQVLRAIREYLQTRRVVVDVISPTGITALTVHGKTVYSYAGWTPKHDEFPKAKLERHAGKDRNWRRLNATETLIIEEISMISNSTFTRLDWVLRAARHVEQPFGGVQIIVTGDFFQLPPVKPFANCLYCGLRTTQNVPLRNRVDCEEHGAFLDRDKFAFSSESWSQCRFEHVELTTIHRQSDPVFTGMLNKIRVGIPLSASEDAQLRSAGDHLDPRNAIKLNTRRYEVNQENAKQLGMLAGPTHSFRCLDSGYWNRELHPELQGSWDRINPNDEDSPYVAYSTSDGDRHRLDDVMSMKIGMPVILLTNAYQLEGLANGSQGTLIHFEPHNEGILPRTKNASAQQVRHGQVVLSGPHAKFQQSNIRRFAHHAGHEGWPVVQFKQGPILTIHPHCEVQELGVALTECTQEDWSLRSRTQIPLLPGWSITVHKSQGMTLDRAVVDLLPAWEPGQVYTAMSRVKDLVGLKVTSMGTGRAMQANETVKRFYEDKFGGQAGADM